MNWLDLGLVIFVIVSVLSGIRDGLSRSGFGLLAVTLAFLSAAWLYPSNLWPFLIVFVGVIGACALGAFLLGEWFKRSRVGWLDRILGGAFGFTNALLFSIFCVLIVMAFAPRFSRSHVVRSRVAPYAIEAAHSVAHVVPPEMKLRVEESYTELLRVLPPKLRRAASRLNAI